MLNYIASGPGATRKNVFLNQALWEKKRLSEILKHLEVLELSLAIELWFFLVSMIKIEKLLPIIIFTWFKNYTMIYVSFFCSYSRMFFKPTLDLLYIKKL